MTAALFIVTGHSRGLGAALAEALLAPQSVVLGLSRGQHPQLDALAAQRGATAEQWGGDLSDATTLAARLEHWLGAQPRDRFARAMLINNAALIAPAGRLQDAAADDLLRVVRVGLEAPLLLTAAFLRGTASWAAHPRVLNVSSGLGRRAMAGQTSYCAIKAGLDNATRALALEGVDALSLAPGVIDTDMQTRLRDSDPAGFPDHASFVQLQAQGRLDTPAQAAAKLLAWIDMPSWPEPIGDVRQPPAR